LAPRFLILGKDLASLGIASQSEFAELVDDIEYYRDPDSHDRRPKCTSAVATYALREQLPCPRVAASENECIEVGELLTGDHGQPPVYGRTILRGSK
jgi:hypothetical protein